MGSSRKIVQRVTLRVGISSLGEICGRAVNLLLPFAVIAVHGTNLLTDNFFLAMAVAFFIQGTLANVTITALVPEFIKNGEKRSLHMFLRWPIIAGALAALVAGLLTTESLSASASIICIASVTVMAISGLTAAPAVAALNADHRYGMPGFVWGLRIIPVAIYLLWSPDTSNLHWLLAGLAVADTARLGILLCLARKWLSLHTNFTPLIFPQTAQHLILASATVGLTPLAARWIASFGDAGTVSLFEAADRIYAAVASLATIGVGNVTLVYLARLNGTDQERKGWRLILWVSMAWSLLWLIIGILLWAAFPLVSIWTQPSMGIAANTVRHTFLALVLGIPAFIMTGIFSRRLITLGLSQSLIFMSFVGFLFSLIGGALFFSILGVPGIAVALSCTQYLVAWMMLHTLVKKSRHAYSRSS